MWNVGIWDVRDVERENTEWSLIYVIVKDTPNSVIFHFLCHLSFFIDLCVSFSTLQ